ncbi:hypothetical protein ACWGKW_40795 [Streptomyces sp. NPDC054766]
MWLDDLGIPDDTPYLLSPCLVYDSDLNSYSHQANLMEGPLNSQINRASALCRKLNFLHQGRGGKDWHDATEADHTAYHYWRRRDPRGPRVDGDTWSQEVSHIHQFYVYEIRSMVVILDHSAAYTGRTLAEVGQEILKWIYERITTPGCPYRAVTGPTVGHPRGPTRPQRLAGPADMRPLVCVPLEWVKIATADE